MMYKGSPLMPTDDVKLETHDPRNDYAGADEDYSSDAPVARPSMAGLIETAAKRGIAVSTKRGLAPTVTTRGLPMATKRGLMASSTKRGIALAAAGVLPSTGSDDDARAELFAAPTRELS